MDEWGFSILRPFHQYYDYIGTLKGDRGDNDKGVCNGASFIRFIPVDHNTLRERDIRFNRK